MTLWGGRFSGKLDPQAWALNASLGFDRRLALQDVRGSIAWAQALEKAGVLTHDESTQICRRVGDDPGRIRTPGIRLPGKRRGYPYRRGTPPGGTDRANRRETAHRAQPQRPGGHRPAPVAARSHPEPGFGHAWPANRAGRARRS